MRVLIAYAAAALMFSFVLLSHGSLTVRSQEADPWVSIISPLSHDVLNDNSIYVEWIGDNVVNYSVEMDGSGFMYLGDKTEKLYSGLGKGEHFFRVKAYGASGRSYIDSVRFTIDRVRPTAKYYGPTGIDVPTRTNITFEFSEEMDAGSVLIAVNDVEGYIKWSGRTVYLIPTTPLRPDIIYHVNVIGKDIAGNDMASAKWTFECIDVGKYQGNVIDISGRPIQYVQIELDDGTVFFTEQDGTFSFRSTYGNQTVHLSKEGFRSMEVEVFVDADNVVYGDPIQLDQAPSEQGLDINAVFVVLILSLLLSAFVIFAVVKVGRDTGLLPEE